jgi:hypothetical protein
VREGAIQDAVTSALNTTCDIVGSEAVRAVESRASRLYLSDGA